MGFEQDILLRDTNLFPIITIGDKHKISTNSYEDYKPILLNVPSLKESIDLETRKYKINSCTLNVNNFPSENGERFSDSVEGSLINEDVNISWVSPSGSKLIYTGKVRRYTHDSDKATITVEDRSQSTLHKDLPLPDNYLAMTNDIPDRYRGKAIPICYGKVERSPCVVDKNKTVKIDKMDISSLNENTIMGESVSPLLIFVDDLYLPVLEEIEEDLETVTQSDDEDGSSLNIVGIQWTQGDSTTSPDLIFSNNLLPLNNFVQCKHFYKPSIVSMTNSENDFIDNNISEDQMQLIVDDDLATSWDTDLEDTEQFFGEGIGGQITHFKLIIHTDPILNDIETSKIRKIKLNDIQLPIPQDVHGGGDTNDRLYVYPVSSQDSDVETGTVVLLDDSRLPEPLTSLFGFPNWYDDGDSWGDYNEDYTPDYDADIEIELNLSVESTGGTGGIGTEYRLEALFFYDWCGMGDDAPDSGTYQIYFRGHGQIVNASGSNTYTSTLKVNGQLKQIDISAIVDINGAFNKDFYANVTGRLGENATAPDIISDILTNELGHPVATDNTGYSGWKYGFTIKDKLNSKKLLEELSSASPYIPHFTNSGTFLFTVIRDQYIWEDTANPDDPALITNMKTIDNNDVISYSFARTKIEDVKSRIIFSYKWDYARQEFDKSVTYSLEDGAVDILPVVGEGGYERSYYGIEGTVDDIHADSTLVVDSERGKYIRDDTTAEAFAQWLLHWHCNTHLLIKCRLPLKYMELEVGQTITFPELLGGQLAYGINYTRDFMWNNVYTGDIVNGQQVFPVFMINSLNKSLEYIDIECTQMHNLTANHLARSVIIACITPGSWNYVEPVEGQEYTNTGCISASDYEADGCPYEANPTGEFGEDVDPSIVDWADNYDASLNLDNANVFLDTEQGIADAKQWWEEHDFPPPNHPDAPIIVSYENCNWQDYAYHDIKNIVTEIYDGTDWVLIPDSTTYVLPGYDYVKDIILTPEMIEYYDANQKLTIRFSYWIDKLPQPTFNDDSDFLHQFYNATEGSDQYNILITQFSQSDIYTYADTQQDIVIFTREVDFPATQLDLQAVNTSIPGGEDLDIIDSSYSLSVSPFTSEGESYIEQSGTIIIFIKGYIEEGLLLGDMNGDGAVNVLDVVNLINVILFGEYNELGDLDGNGTVNVLDVVNLINLVLFGDD